MVDLMSHVFSPPRDIREKWVSHVDFQLPSKRQKPSGKPQSSNKGLKIGYARKKSRNLSLLFYRLVYILSSTIAKMLKPVCLSVKYPSVRRNRQNGSDPIYTFGCDFANHFFTGAATRPK